MAGVRAAKTKKTKPMVVVPVATRGAFHDLGWLVRSRSRSGSESRQKHPTQEAARDAARELVSMGAVREVWIEPVAHGVRPWRDLEPKDRPAIDVDRAHFISVEEDGE